MNLLERIEAAKTDWEKDSLRWHGRVLTGNKCHWCPDWDYLAIDETCREFEVCTCVWENGEKE